MVGVGSGSTLRQALRQAQDRLRVIGGVWLGE